MSDISFKRRVIKLHFTLHNGAEKTVSGLAVSVHVDNGGLQAGNSATITVWNMSLDDMAQLTASSVNPQVIYKNRVDVLVAEGDNAFQIVFSGGIAEAWANLSSQPNATFVIKATTLYYDAHVIEGKDGITLSSATPLSAVVNQIRGQMKDAKGDVVIDPAVASTMVPAGTKLLGTPVQQLKTLGVNYKLIIDEDPGGKGLWVGNASSVRGTTTVPYWSKETGLIGFPTLSFAEISATALFDPTIMFMGYVTIQAASVPTASGTYQVLHVSHRIDYLTSNPKWETSIRANLPMAKRG